jgi:hypothetical protein
VLPFSNSGGIDAAEEVYNRFGVPSLFVTAVTRSRAQARRRRERRQREFADGG